VFCIDGDLSKLPTNHFLQAMEIGQTLAVDLEPGKTLYVEMTGISAPDDSNEVKVSFKLNGEARFVLVEDKSSGSAKMGGQEKADPNIAGHVGAPMPGVVVGVKMETVVTAVKSGVVKRVQASAGDSLAAGDLLLVIDDSAEDEDEDEDEE
jgi:pyruvate carboxylase